MKKSFTLPQFAIVAVLAGAGTLVGFTTSSAREVPRAPARAAYYTDEAIFRGILLGEGAVANLIPEIRNHAKPENYIKDRNLLSRVHELKNEVVKQVQADDPRLIHEFARKMRSGDHFLIKSAIQEATGKMKRAVATVVSRDEARARAAAPGTGTIGALSASAAPADATADSLRGMTPLEIAQAKTARDGTCELLLVAAAAVVLAVVVFVSTAAFVVNYAAGAQVLYALEIVYPQTDDASASIVQEQIVDSVARLLVA